MRIMTLIIFWITVIFPFKNHTFAKIYKSTDFFGKDLGLTKNELSLVIYLDWHTLTYNAEDMARMMNDIEVPAVWMISLGSFHAAYDSTTRDLLEKDSNSLTKEHKKTIGEICKLGHMIGISHDLLNPNSLDQLNWLHKIVTSQCSKQSTIFFNGILNDSFVDIFNKKTFSKLYIGRIHTKRCLSLACRHPSRFYLQESLFQSIMYSNTGPNREDGILSENGLIYGLSSSEARYFIYDNVSGDSLVHRLRNEDVNFVLLSNDKNKQIINKVKKAL